MKGSDIKMNDLNILINEIISEDQEIKEQIELLDLKYKLIDELINFRKAYKLSQSEFADMIKVDKQMISRFEKGEVDPKLSFISKILHGMNKEINIRDKI
ncbi:helix-turn-helix domain-containing protein [Acetoanaerobium noterae]|uniref:helix-turn-helix domain-containing protein n=1 Tax=Acetoanaerobium noterae TaxID=745369 RepID=UPI003319D0D5